MKTESEKKLQMAKIKALNTIPKDRRVAVEGFVEEIKFLPEVAWGLVRFDAVERAMRDDEEAVKFVNSFEV